MGWSIDHFLQRVTGYHIRIVDKNGPTVDKDKKADVNVTVKREEEDEDVIRDRLKVAVDGMKSMR